MALNICIDIGNTNAKIAYFNNDELEEVLHNISDRGIQKIIKGRSVDNILISSVRKGIGRIVKNAQKKANTIILNYKTPLPIKNNYKTPHTLGVDRVASVVAANFLYNSRNNLIIDLGTCITYDLIDSTGTYQGGGISPGVEMRLKAMHKFTSKLPIVSAKRSGSPDLIGKTTKECMSSGAVNGTIAELDGIIRQYKQFFEDLNIIFCGGDAIFFETKIKDHIFAIPNLVLVGLNQILRYNLND